MNLWLEHLVFLASLLCSSLGPHLPLLRHRSRPHASSVFVLFAPTWKTRSFVTDLRSFSMHVGILMLCGRLCVVVTKKTAHISDWPQARASCSLLASALFLSKNAFSYPLPLSTPSHLYPGGMPNLFGIHGPLYLGFCGPWVRFL